MGRSQKISNSFLTAKQDVTYLSLPDKLHSLFKKITMLTAQKRKSGEDIFSAGLDQGRDLCYASDLSSISLNLEVT